MLVPDILFNFTHLAMPTTKSGLTHTAGLIRDGKGISTSAGIPDFRSPGTGLYDNLAALNLPFPEAVFSLDYFEERPEPFWTLAKDLYPGKYLPTPTHYFIALLHKKGLLQRVWTQNIDTLETMAGVPADLVLEAHGSFRRAHCLDCRREASTDHVLASGVREGKVVRCSHCEGLVKPDIVFFGEGLPEDFFLLQRELRKTDLVLVIGTSLQVMPFAGLVNAVPRETPRFLINREAVGPFGDLDHDEKRGRDAAWLGDADEAVWRLAEAVGWAEELEEMLREGKRKLKEDWARKEKMGAPEAEAAAAEEEETPVHKAQHAMADKAKDEEHKKEEKEHKKEESQAKDDNKVAPDAAGEKPEAEQSKSLAPTVEDADDVDALTEAVQRIGIDKSKAKV